MHPDAHCRPRLTRRWEQVGIDHLLTASHFEADDDIFQLNNGMATENLALFPCYIENHILFLLAGCLCCTVRSDLAPIIQKLYLGQAKTGRLDGIIVETTGLAVPNPIAQTFLTDLPGMVTKLDAVVTLVDAVNVERHLAQERQAPEAQAHQFGELGFKCVHNTRFGASDVYRDRVLPPNPKLPLSRSVGVGRHCRQTAMRMMPYRTKESTSPMR